MKLHGTKKLLRAIIFCCGCELMSMMVFSQNIPAALQHIRQITTEQGLSNNYVFKILQDKNGFLWFLTFNGLDRYDGSLFKNYSYSPQHSQYIMPGFFVSMEEDQTGNFWIGDGSAGIYSFDPEAEKFTHYVHQPGDSNSLSSDENCDFVIGKNRSIWIATLNGLDVLNPATGIFKHYIHSQNDSTSIRSNFVASICADDDDNLWVMTAAPGIDYFSPATGKVMKHFDYGSTSLVTSAVNAVIFSVRQGRNGNIWIGTRDNGLFCFNTRTKKVDHFLHDKSDKFSISGNAVLNAFEDSGGNLWIGMNDGGIDYYDHSQRKFFHVSELKSQSVSLGIVSQVFEDLSHKIWIACDNGLFTIDPQYKKFTVYQHADDDASSIADNFGSSFFRDSRGQFFIGTNAVNLADGSVKKFKQLSLIENGKNILTNNIVWQIYEDRKKILWFATYNGLASYDPVTKKHHWYVFDSRDSTTVSGQSVTGISEDHRGRYWVVSADGGLDAFDPATGKFRAFKVHAGNNSISTNSIGGLFVNSQGILYMGSLFGGLVTFNPDNETFKIYRHNSNDPSSISCDLVNGSFAETKSGIIWLPTTGGGVNAFNPITGKFKAFTKEDGLSTNNLATIVQDNNGNYWLGTLNGISCFTPPQDPFDPKCRFHFRNYDISDGLPGNVINYFATYKDASGKIYFGTDGVFSFYPDDLKDNDFIPPVFITDFKLFNQSVSANDSSRILVSQIENTKEIKLSYKQNVISFTFAALNYIHPEKNQYAYKLDGFDKNWIYTDATKHFANYTNLDPGEYTFEVRGSNNDGVWNETPATIKLIITPPFWQTWWFRMLVAVAIAGIIYGIYRNRLQQVVRLQLIRNNIASDLHDEIGSTLNSISILSSVAKQQAGKSLPALDQIGANSRKVIEAMNDIVWTINPENDSFEKILVRMRSFAHQVMKGKEIEFIFHTDEKLNALSLPMQTRKNFYLIFKEATINIARYSSATHANFSVTNSDHQIQLTIRDNGIGFNTSNASPGNGIKNMQRRAKEINADLKIESSKGEGASVELTLKT